MNTSEGHALTVRQVDPGAAYRAQKNAIDAAVGRVLNSGRYLLDAEVAAFELEFAKWLGAARVVACSSGTDALALLLRGLGVGPGCSVVTVSHTFIATVAAIEMTGAVPILVDVEPDHYTMDAHDLAAVLDDPPPGLPPIRAVIVVHLYGQPADMSAIVALCARHDIPLLEDCSQAHGASIGGRRVGTLAAGAAFSFYPTKNLAALGDAGAVTVRSAELAERIMALRQYGCRTRQVSIESGVNSRMDEIQAAVLRVKLPSLDLANRRRRAIASAYDRALASSSVRPPARRPGAEHVFHQYVVRVADREKEQAHLRGLGIETSVHYPIPVHRQPGCIGRLALGPSGCRASDGLVNRILSLPMFPEMTDAQVECVANALRSL
jgi:dTDP-4-amino-4,6-dideoxygalactose transaminase